MYLTRDKILKITDRREISLCFLSDRRRDTEKYWNGHFIYFSSSHSIDDVLNLRNHTAIQIEQICDDIKNHYDKINTRKVIIEKFGFKEATET